MEFKSLTNIESSFRRIRLMLAVFTGCCALITGVVISLFGKVHIVVIGALVRQLQGTAYIVFDRVLLRREREEQLVKASYVFPRLGRTVLRKILRKGHHQRFAPVKHIDFLALLLGKAV
mgnify:CR=1 FL=1